MEGRQIQVVAGDREHGTNIAQMFFRATLPVVFKFTNYHVFRWREHHRFPFELYLPPQLESPGIQFISPSEVEISLEARREVNEFEMAALLPSCLGGVRFRWRHIKIRGRKCFGQRFNIGVPEKDDKSTSCVSHGSP